jgi:protein SCO1/2
MKKKAKSPQHHGLKPVLMFVAALFVALALGLGIRYGLTGADSPVATPVTIGGPFALVDQTGKQVTEATYFGKYPLIYFGYTFCPDVCPTSLGTMAEALAKLPEDKRAKIQPILITLDPERDGKEKLGDYVNAFYPGMAGLWGTPDEIAKVAKLFRVYYAKVPSTDPEVGYTLDHSALLYLMGPDGKFIRHFTHGTQADEMAKALLESVK